MRKWFDKYIAQSYRRQLVAMGLLFLVIAFAGAFVGIIAFSERDDTAAVFGHNWLWGVMMCLNGDFISETVRALTEVDGGTVTQFAPAWAIAVSVLYLVFGMVLVAFFTGAVTEFLNMRRQKIFAGDVDYSFDGNYALVVGYDFQVNNLVKHLLEDKSQSVALVTGDSAEKVNRNVLQDLSPGEQRRLYVMRKEITLPDTYSNFKLTAASGIYIIGDGGAVGRDGQALRALEEITAKVEREKAKEEAATKAKEEKTKEEKAEKDTSAKAEEGAPAPNIIPIKVYLHIEDAVLYSKVRAVELPADKCKFLDLEVCNYYESWAWECWSCKDSKDSEDDAYLPLRHRPGTSRTELFVIGAGRMGRAMVDFALPLLNYGDDGKKNRVTIFDANPLKKGFLPDRKTLDALPETEVRYLPMDGCSDEANEKMLEAASREDTSVTVVVALSDPGAAIRAYSALSNQLRRLPVSVLIWQAMASDNCPRKRFLRMPGAEADKTELRYFGMTDVLPWLKWDETRYEYGKAVNFYYGHCGNPELIAKAKDLWSAEGAEKAWLITTDRDGKQRRRGRWEKWSSINSGDSFREKSVLVPSVLDAETVNRVLKAEHNRWWTERLLSGWVYNKNRDNGEMHHPDMVPSEDLDQAKKDIDKINIAAMVQYGFIDAEGKT